MVAAYPDSAGDCSGEVFAGFLCGKSGPDRKRFRLNSPAHLVKVIGSFSSRWKFASGGVFRFSMPDHTRRRCDHAFWDSVHEHDRVGVG